uniref:Putative transporter abc superfamily breast cancer resistance protein n=1 Tax=Anopheles darlingi TaxID=43151 RepID=A0A2M4DMR8_ANODA
MCSFVYLPLPLRFLLSTASGTTMSSEETVEVVIPLVKSITNLTFRNLSFSVPQRPNDPGSGGEDRKHLLRNISGTLKSGRLTAILGPSGAGKSTLLDILSGFRTQGVSGKILINNELVDCHKYRQLVAYMAQDVPLLGNLTVRETLHYVADLRLSKNVSYIHKTKIVNDIVTLLGLDKCSHSLARVLSGGERKRLSIGLELVSNPKIMFFDEPTSGLDSVASYQVIAYMRDLARQGRCVASVIHQPSSELLELFDDVYVVADGRCMFQGSLDELIPTLEEVGFTCPPYYNRADFVLKIASQRHGDVDSVEKLIARADTAINGFLEHDATNGEDTASVLATSRRTSAQYPICWWRQFVVLTRRTMLGTVRNITLTRFRLLGHLLFGLTIGSVFYDVGDDATKVLSNVSCLILFLMFIVFSNAMTVVLTCKPITVPLLSKAHKLITINCGSIWVFYSSSRNGSVCEGAQEQLLSGVGVLLVEDHRRLPTDAARSHLLPADRILPHRSAERNASSHDVLGCVRTVRLVGPNVRHGRRQHLSHRCEPVRGASIHHSRRPVFRFLHSLQRATGRISATYVCELLSIRFRRTCTSLVRFQPD